MSHLANVLGICDKNKNDTLSNFVFNNFYNRRNLPKKEFEPLFLLGMNLIFCVTRCQFSWLCSHLAVLFDLNDLN